MGCHFSDRNFWLSGSNLMTRDTSLINHLQHKRHCFRFNFTETIIDISYTGSTSLQKGLNPHQSQQWHLSTLNKNIYCTKVKLTCSIKSNQKEFHYQEMSGSIFHFCAINLRLTGFTLWKKNSTKKILSTNVRSWGFVLLAPTHKS